MATNATLGLALSGKPATPNWQTNAQFYGTPVGPYGSLSGNVGGAGQDSSQQQVSSADLLGLTPANLAALQALGWTGGDPNAQPSVNGNVGGADALGQASPNSAAFEQWLAQNGYQTKSYVADQRGAGQNTSALFDANGNELNGTQRTYAPDVNEDAFGIGILGAAGFAGAAAAGLGAAGSGAGASGLSSSDLGALYGDAGYGGTSTGSGLGGLSSNAVNFVSDPSFAASGAGSDAEAAAASDAGGGSLGGAAPGSATGTSATGSTGILGTGVSGTQAASGASAGLSGLSGSSSTPYSDYDSGPGAGSAGQSLTTSPSAAGYTTGSTTDPYSSGSSGGFGSSLQSMLQNSNGTGLSSLGQALVGTGVGALTGSLGGGNTGLLNQVNFQNAATAQGQSGRTNQSNAQGQLQYTQNGVDAQGNPTYSQNVSLNAPYQSNLNSALGNQGTALGNLNTYNSGLNAAYAAAPSLYGNAGSQAGLVKQAQDAAYNSQTSYLDPQYAQLQKQLQAQLANQGVSYGSDAYNAAQTQFGSQQNQAYGTARDSAISQGDTYANTLFNQNLQANQQYNTNLNNQGTNLLNQSGQSLTGVVQNPTFAATPAQTPYLSAAQLQGGANLNQYNAKIGNTNNLTNGLTGLAGAAIGNSNFWSGLGSAGSGLAGLFSGG